MSNIKQVFYETTYRKEKIGLKPRSSIMGKLYLLFKKFESYRGDVAFNLLISGNNYLDIGCGNGDMVNKCLTKFDKVYGIDIARTRLKEANNRLSGLSKRDKKRIYFKTFDADNTYPFNDNFFDSVTMIATLEHFFDPYQVMSEVTRITKPGGQLIIQVPNLGFITRRLVVIMGNLPVTSEDEYGWDGGHLHYFTVKSLINLMEKYKYKVKKVTCSGVFANIRRFWVSMLGADIVIISNKL